MNKEAPVFHYRRALSIGRYIAIVDLFGPIPNSENALNDESVEASTSTYLTRKAGNTFYTNAIPAQPCTKRQHLKMTNYLNAEGFNELLCSVFSEDWNFLKESGEFEGHDEILSDKNNAAWLFCAERNELFDPNLQSGVDFGQFLDENDPDDETSGNEQVF